MNPLLIARSIKVAVVFFIGVFFALIAFNNITDFESNWIAVQHITSMDTTFKSPDVMWRAVTNPVLQKSIYFLIIFFEVMTALLCFSGVYQMAANIKKTPPVFHAKKTTAQLGLLLGFILYFGGFLIVAGEWFCMWQSEHWNFQGKAGLFLSFIMFAMLYLGMAE